MYQRLIKFDEQLITETPFEQHLNKIYSKRKKNL